MQESRNNHLLNKTTFAHEISVIFKIFNLGQATACSVSSKSAIVYNKKNHESHATTS